MLSLDFNQNFYLTPFTCDYRCATPPIPKFCLLLFFYTASLATDGP